MSWQAPWTSCQHWLPWLEQLFPKLPWMAMT